jgi:hypothetical protein
MRTKIVSGVLGITLLLTLVHISSTLSLAQEKKYPSRPIEIVSGYPPGGGMSLLLRPTDIPLGLLATIVRSMLCRGEQNMHWKIFVILPELRTFAMYSVLQ